MGFLNLPLPLMQQNIIYNPCFASVFLCYISSYLPKYTCVLGKKKKFFSVSFSFFFPVFYTFYYFLFFQGRRGNIILRKSVNANYSFRIQLTIFFIFSKISYKSFISLESKQSSVDDYVINFYHVEKVWLK